MNKMEVVVVLSAVEVGTRPLEQSKEKEERQMNRKKESLLGD